MGLEAFSREAGFVVFIDNNRIALDLIKRNIGLCLSGYTGSCGLQVIQHDLTKVMPRIFFPPNSQTVFDLIFVDPPYGKNISLSVLISLNKSTLLAENGMLIVEERFNMTLPNELSHLCIFDKRVYGECGFWFYKPSCYLEGSRD